MDRQVWRVLDGEPFHLVYGNRNHNLDVLKTAPRPDHPCAYRMQELVKVSHNRKDLLQVLELMAHSHCSTIDTERMHKVIKILTQYHSRFCVGNIQERSFLGLLLPLCREPALEKRDKQLLGKIAELEHREPEKQSGKSIFVAEFTRGSAGMLTEAARAMPDDVEPMELQRGVFGRASAAWKTLPKEVQDIYDKKRDAQVALEKQQIKDELETLRAEQAQRKTKEVEKAEHKVGLGLVSDTRFSQEALDVLQQRWESSALSQSDLKERRAKAWQAITEPNVHQMSYLNEQPFFRHGKVYEDGPLWTDQVARARDHFLDAVIRVEKDDEDLFQVHARLK